MKKIIWLCFFLTISAGLFAQSEAQRLLESVDRLISFQEDDLSAEYTIVKREPGGATESTVATIFRRDGEDKFMILILKPDADKGKGYLKIDDNLWLYDPVGRSFTFTSAKERLQNSSARISDFTRSDFSLDYKAVNSYEEKLGVWDCTVLELEALNDEVSFPKVKLWVSEDNLIRKMEDYSLSGQRMRVTAIPRYQKLEDKWLPYNLVMLDYLRSRTINGKTEYERTTITVSKPSLSELPDSLFTKEYLERVNQ
ncbi:outer membrane lipoprotein-sorting protein [Spirochaeta isovalerica]|uniref:Outer membrane lipoprotein-sorting protein n=1 Tax=Spirochaeta isovalerica TaxID=150 RepID=A0A841RA13_9SPIO|nr:outer membrane lipoprotein-sorting protein [Spirochaeta isovalerica]MBB6480733.1 outer membrane lipoprotein-sorting protein [Spirochaeta isovalerica]